jgi:hypothetical protein
MNQDSSLFEKVASMPSDLAPNHPDSINLVQAYLEQQLKVVQLAKRLSFYTVIGSKYSGSDSYEEQLALRKHELALEKFVEDYIESHQANIKELSANEGIKKLMFARLVKACESYYTLSLHNGEKQAVVQAKIAAEEAKKDFDRTVTLLD